VSVCSGLDLVSDPITTKVKVTVLIVLLVPDFHYIEHCQIYTSKWTALWCRLYQMAAPARTQTHCLPRLARPGSVGTRALNSI
jgi:hypothetical protein